MPRTWTLSEEAALLQAICHFKPCGRNKMFHMISILKALNFDNKPVITASDIREKLEEFYDLEKLDELEELSGDSEDSEEEDETPPRRLITDNDGDAYEEFELLPVKEYHQSIEKHAVDSNCSSPSHLSGDESEEEEKEPVKEKAAKRRTRASIVATDEKKRRKSVRSRRSLRR